MAGSVAPLANAKSSRRWIWCACALVLNFIGNGCAIHKSGPTQPTVHDLIQEALEKSEQTRELAIVNEVSAVVYEEPADDPWLSPPYGSGITNREPYTAHVESQQEGPRVSEDFIETDVREALLILAEEAEIDLVMDEGVAGVVNTRIDDLTIDDAIEKVLLPLGLVSARHGNRIIVAPADPSSPLFSYVAETTEYRPLHLDAATLISTVPKSFEKFVNSIEGNNLIL